MVPPPFRLNHQQLARAAHGSDRAWRAALREQQLHHLDDQKAIPAPLRELSRDARRRSRLQRVDRVAWLALGVAGAAVALMSLVWWVFVPSWPLMALLLTLICTAGCVGTLGVVRGARQLRADQSPRRMATLRELWQRDVVISDGRRVVQSIALTTWALQVRRTLRELKRRVPYVHITAVNRGDSIQLTAAMNALQKTLDDNCAQLESDLERLTLQVGTERRPATRTLQAEFPSILCLWAEVERLRQRLDPTGQHLPALPRPVGASHPIATAQNLRPITLQ